MALWSRQSLDNAPNYAAAPRSGNNSQNSRALNPVCSWWWRSFRGRIPSMTVRDLPTCNGSGRAAQKGVASMRGYVIARAQIAPIWLATLSAVTPDFSHRR